MRKRFKITGKLNSRRVFLSAGILALFVFIAAKAPRLNDKAINFPPPKIIRTCCSFGTDLRIAGIPFVRRTDITSIEKLGKHTYLGGNEEENGIIYCARGGFVDIGHLRDYADWTAYLHNLINTNLGAPNPVIVDLGSEGGNKTLYIDLSNGLNAEDALQLAGKIAYDLSLWHEIATWYGASYIPLIPERYSSFSPEDLYSNLLGVKLGMQALSTDMSFEDAMTEILTETLAMLEAYATEDETYAAMEEVENVWWTGEKPLPSKNILLKHYFDTDSYLVPWLLPSANSETNAFKLNKPKNDFSDIYELRIKTNYKIPAKLIKPEAVDKIITQNDFKQLMELIQQEKLNDQIAIQNM